MRFWAATRRPEGEFARDVMEMFALGFLHLPLPVLDGTISKKSRGRELEKQSP